MKLPVIYPRDPLPIYAQLERSIRTMILTGDLKTGEQLPTVRQLAVDLAINANTVSKVYAELERTGVVETRKGVGTFVREHTVKSSVDRQQQLHDLLAPTLAELQRHGYTVDDIIAFLEKASQ